MVLREDGEGPRPRRSPRRDAGEPLALSIVVPARDEALNLGPLLEGIASACAGVRFEAIVVDDASGDDTRAVLAGIGQGAPWLRALRHDAPGGQSAAIHSGVLAARAALVCTLDGDGQNPPEDIARLLAAWEGWRGEGALGLVAGQRLARRDALSRRLASRAANALRAAVLRDATRDTGCGLKLFRRDAFLALPYFDHMHRYLPALFAAQGWAVAHCDVGHAPRRAGRSNYTNLGRALVGVADLAGVAWLIHRRKRVRAVEPGAYAAAAPGPSAADAAPDAAPAPAPPAPRARAPASACGPAPARGPDGSGGPPTPSTRVPASDPGPPAPTPLPTPANRAGGGAP